MVQILARIFGFPLALPHLSTLPFRQTRKSRRGIETGPENSAADRDGRADSV